MAGAGAVRTATVQTIARKAQEANDVLRFTEASPCFSAATGKNGIAVEIGKQRPCRPRLTPNDARRRAEDRGFPERRPLSRGTGPESVAFAGRVEAGRPPPR